MSSQTSECGCDSTAHNLMTIDEANVIINESINKIISLEIVAIRDSLNRILASDIISKINVPSDINSAMDGYAIKYNDLVENSITKLKIVGTSFAGKPWHGKLNCGETIRIMTGAVLPGTADSVIMQEHVNRNDDYITIEGCHKKSQNVRGIGEDVNVGDVILKKGKLIRPAEMGLLASMGISEIKVMQKLRVAFFSTGDELQPLESTLSSGQIYDSNRYSLFGMLSRLGVELIDLGVIKDDKELIRQTFISAAECADVVITSGGVSVGDADYVKEILDEQGTITFWKLAIKPGKPLAFGKMNQSLFFGLPGNPVSVMATFYMIVQPALLTMMGHQNTQVFTVQARVLSDIKKRPGRLEFQRGILQQEKGQPLTVNSTGGQGSHMMTSMSNANCFIVLEQDNDGVKKGEMVNIILFDGFM
ncbi:MAG: molybdopterin molybdotransferase MoeA [Methylococcales bacterium]|jgi:molybdopterin molybdotransferase|nr:molybdopterin molybdotransferase MoeA [Methylococcales bacterium]MBT7410069.1 molybdopterin molybdotransferase MoeA [Methylococcales bacterium]